MDNLKLHSKSKLWLGMCTVKMSKTQMLFWGLFKLRGFTTEYNPAQRIVAFCLHWTVLTNYDVTNRKL